MSDAINSVSERVRAAVGPQRQHSRAEVQIWRVLTLISYLLVLITTVYYTFNKPHEGEHKRRKIWRQNSHQQTPFALNSVIVNIYWIVLWILQLPYLFNLYQSEEILVTAVNFAPHFTFNNLLNFGFVNLWCRSYFWWAELLVIVNFFNLTAAYFRYPKLPKVMHIAVLAGPLAWTFVALYWDGAAMVGSTQLPARIVANVFIWSWLVYGGFYLVAFKDYTFGFCLSVLTAALGVGQFFTKVFALQWMFAFSIMAVLFVASLGVAFPEYSRGWRREQDVAEDRERAPLLAGES